MTKIPASGEREETIGCGETGLMLVITDIDVVVVAIEECNREDERLKAAGVYVVGLEVIDK